MAIVRKIKEGLFSVSWKFNRVDSESFSETAEVHLNDIDEICKLTYRTDVDKFGEDTLEVVFRKEQSNYGVFQKHNNTGRLGCLKETGTRNVTASFCGVPKVLIILNGLKWEASWEKCNPIICNQCGEAGLLPAIVFEILIELKFTSSHSDVACFKKGQENILNHLGSLWKNKTLSDITFKCEDASIRAHTLIIASGSPVLAAMFQNDYGEKEERVVEIKDIKPSVLEQLLRYFYTGDINFKQVNVDELLTAADKYVIDSLKEECAQNLAQSINLENAVHYLVLAHLHSSPNLMTKVINFMTSNAKAVSIRQDWLDIIKNYPELCFTVVQQMVV